MNFGEMFRNLLDSKLLCATLLIITGIAAYAENAREICSATCEEEYSACGDANWCKKEFGSCIESCPPTLQVGGGAIKSCVSEYKSCIPKWEDGLFLCGNSYHSCIKSVFPDLAGYRVSGKFFREKSVAVLKKNGSLIKPTIRLSSGMIYTRVTQGGEYSYLRNVGTGEVFKFTEGLHRVPLGSYVHGVVGSTYAHEEARSILFLK
jgi:hypothetical protein